MAAHQILSLSRDDSFRQDYLQNFAEQGLDYNECFSAWLLGEELGRDRRYRSRDWNHVEPEARQIWDRRRPGSWKMISEAAHHGFEHIRQMA